MNILTSCFCKTSVMLLLLATVSPESYSQAGQVLPVNTDRKVTTISIKIGNTIIPNILLDTGFPWDGVIIYNPSYNDSLDLAGAVQVSLGGAGSGDPQQALMVDSASFFVGPVQLTNQRIVALQSDLYKGFPSNGVIGHSIFGRFAAEIDYDRDLLILYDPETFVADTSWTSIPMFLNDNGVPGINASISIEAEDPVAISTYIDFADQNELVLLEKPGMKYTLPKETTAVLLGRGLSGDVYGTQGIVARLIIGPYALTDVTASIANAEIRSKQHDGDAILGSGALSRFNLIFDYKGRQLLLKPNSSY